MTKRIRLPLVLDVQAAGKEPPSEFRIFRAGVNETFKGPVLFDDDAAEAVMGEYSRRGMDVALDYVHQAVSDPPVDAPAAGWMALELRSGELWAKNVRWTDKARAQLSAGEYRYFSPTLGSIEETVYEDRLCIRPLMLLTVSLTNIPAMEGLEPLVALGFGARDRRTFKLDAQISFNETARRLCEALEDQFDYCAWVEEVYDDHLIFSYDGRFFQISYALESARAVLSGDAVEVRRTYVPIEGGIVMKTVMAALSLSSSASEAEALSAVNKLLQERGELLALTGKSSVSEALGVLQAWKSGHAQTEQLSAKLAKLEGDAVKAEAEGIFAKLKSEGRAVEGQKEFLLSMGQKDIGQLRAYAASAPRILGVEVKAPAPKGDGTPAGIVDGKKWEELKPVEKSALYQVNRAAYDALKADYENRTGVEVRATRE